MNCERCSEILVEYIHGGLSPEERAMVAEHLSECKECARELEEYVEIRRVVTEESPLPEPSREVMARLSKAARDRVSREKRPFYKRLPYSPFLIPALSTAIALMVWFYYGNLGRDVMDTASYDVMARKMKEPGSRMETVGQAAPDSRREYPAEAESSPALGDIGESGEGMPAAPAPLPQEETRALSDDLPDAGDGAEEVSRNKESALLDEASKKSEPARPAAEAESLTADAAKVDYSELLRLAQRQQTEGDCDASIKTNEILLQSYPEPPANVQAQSYRSLAECYEMQGKLDLAVMNYTQLGRVSPGESGFANSRIMRIRDRSMQKIGSTSPAPSPVN
ncbi:MAG: zf-HC2 domain-containing protein [Thermodesulfobacteriota bacterium]